MAGTDGKLGVYDIDTKLEIDGETRYPASVALNYAVNSYANLHVVHYNGERAENSAIDITNQDVYDSMGKRQSLIFAPRDKYDTYFSMGVYGDDADLSLGFFGFVVNPQFAFGVQQVAQSDSCIDEFAKIDELNLSIYAEGPSSIIKAPGTPLEDCGWSVPMCAMKIVEELMSNEPENNTGLPDIDFECRKAQHKINQEVVKYFYELMENSEESFGWKDILSSQKESAKAGIDEGIRNFMASCFKASTGSFLTNIAQFAAGFCCLMVPDVKDGGFVTYKLVNRDKVYEDPEDLEVAVINTSIAAGSGAGLFPMRYVAVVPANTTADAFRAEALPGSQFVAYPQENMTAGGSAIRIPQPPWLKDVESVQEVKEDGDPVDEEDLDMDEFEDFVDNTWVGSTEDNRESKADIMLQWAKSAYRWVSLERAQVIIDVPLLKNIVPGKRYKVKSKGSGSTLFTGFCASVTHTVVTQSVRSARSQVTFTHVEMPGFSLPGSTG